MQPLRYKLEAPRVLASTRRSAYAELDEGISGRPSRWRTRGGSSMTPFWFHLVERWSLPKELAEPVDSFLPYVEARILLGDLLETDFVEDSGGWVRIADYPPLRPALERRRRAVRWQRAWNAVQLIGVLLLLYWMAR